MAIAGTRTVEMAATVAVEARTEERVLAASGVFERTEEGLRQAEAVEKSVGMQATVQASAYFLTKTPWATLPSLPAGGNKPHVTQ